MQTETQTGKLTVSTRSSRGKGAARQLRTQGLTPGVVYGGTDSDPRPIPIAFDPTALLKSLHPTKKRNTVFEMTIEGGNAPQTELVMLKDFQTDELRGGWIHADFIRVSNNVAIDAQVPLLMEGRAPGVKMGGTLHQVFRKLPVRCIPSAIPECIIANVDGMEIGSTLAVRDLPVPEGVTISLPEQQTCVQLYAPRKMDEALASTADGEGEAEADAAAAKSEG
ncbi:MAG: 50S ribosomal protein L25 [Deltaproteobacteria bacterium]|nr:50S ribosomal protein L25 [Deltaproteobacteria bacterium]